tara:strand:- start:176 stop:874 length:699 start_codon:yes stop_codon:yes gene_type:complete
MNTKDLLSILFYKLENQYLISIIIISSLIVFILRKQIQDKFKKFNFRKDSKQITKISALIDHDIFRTFSRVVNEVSNMQFYTNNKYDSTKSRMCLDFTKQKSISCQFLMKEIILTKDIQEMSTDTLKKLILEKQSQMHTNYVREIRVLWLSKGISTKNVDHVIRLFESFRFDVVQSFEHRISAIFGSSFHPNNFERILAVFDMWAMGIDLLPKDMNTTFEKLNGKFKDIKYN